MRSVGSRLEATLVCAAAALSLSSPSVADAACDPATCDAVFACGFRECVGLKCQSFMEDAGTLCRSAAGVCDVAETCTGASLSCPSDKKKSAAVVCRAAAGSCDAAEHCTGASSACPADVGVTPAIDSLVVLDRHNFFGSGGGSHLLSVVLEGANLCTTTFESQTAITSPVQLGDETPRSRIAVHLVLNQNPLPNDVYSFAVNRGAIAGEVPFLDGEPDFGVDIDSPRQGTTVGPHATATLGIACTHCELARAWVSDGDPFEPIAFTDVLLPPFSLSFVERLDELADMPEGLADGDYKFTAEVVDGELDEFQTFAGDPSGATFEYLFGTSDLVSVDFTVPDASAPASGWATVAALAAWARARARPRRRRRAPPPTGVSSDPTPRAARAPTRIRCQQNG